MFKRGNERRLGVFESDAQLGYGPGLCSVERFQGSEDAFRRPGEHTNRLHEQELRILERADALTRDLATVIVQTGMRPIERESMDKPATPSNPVEQVGHRHCPMPDQSDSISLDR